MKQTVEEVVEHMMYRARQHQKLVDVQAPDMLVRNQINMLEVTVYKLSACMLEALAKVHAEDVRCLLTQPPCSYCGRHQMEDENADAENVNFVCTAGHSLEVEARQEYGLQGCKDYTEEGAYFDKETPMRELQTLQERNTERNYYRMVQVIGLKLMELATTKLDTL